MSTARSEFCQILHGGPRQKRWTEMGAFLSKSHRCHRMFPEFQLTEFLIFHDFLSSLGHIGDFKFCFTNWFWVPLDPTAAVWCWMDLCFCLLIRYPMLSFEYQPISDSDLIWSDMVHPASKSFVNQKIVVINDNFIET